ncbi:hypothetical protein, partial [Campylobacter canadensis]|uniref:hypothetical protein n=1 Tax=Campylobacter canadensis TaxID=449520 RepID=UPI001CCA4DB9
MKKYDCVSNHVLLELGLKDFKNYLKKNRTKGFKPCFARIRFESSRIGSKWILKGCFKPCFARIRFESSRIGSKWIL